MPRSPPVAQRHHRARQDDGIAGGCAQVDLGGHAGRNGAVGVGNGDLDREGARLGGGVAADVAQLAFDHFAVDQLHIGVVADVDVAQVALADLALAEDRVEAEDGGDLGALHHGAAQFDADAVDDAVERAP